MTKTILKQNQTGYTPSVHNFDWGLHQGAERFLQNELRKFLQQNSFAKEYLLRIEEKTSTRLFDWIDHIVIPKKKINIAALKNLGFDLTNISSSSGIDVYKYKKAVFFPLLLTGSDTCELALKPELIDNFAKKFPKKIRIEGKKYSPYRRAVLHKEQDSLLTAVERRGTSKFLIEKNIDDIAPYKMALRQFINRKRMFENDRSGLLEVDKSIKNVIKTLSPARAADAFFRAERIYWEGRNEAGREQRKRHDIFGLGWGNHDHHTFRSSRKNFTYLIRVLEQLGFLCRERFFAGEKAGWGAQVLEHPDCNIVIFADIDITKDEKDTDFAHKGLKETKKLGTVGLWVALHGESVLQTGLHHIAARYNFTQVKRDLKKVNIDIMKPFSDFHFLKQAFTVGENWKVDKRRLDTLLKKKALTPEQYKTFQRNGAIGSHLEVIQRRQGFKGFNQDSVTAIIQAVDPRKQCSQ